MVLALSVVLYKPLISYLTSQAGKPQGFVGSVMTKIWSNYFEDLSEWSFTHVSLDDKEKVLDVGFGGGSNIKHIKENNDQIIIYGIDISDEALKTATRENQESIESGKVILALEDVADMPFIDDSFDLIIASQTHMYWDELNIGLSECYRVLNGNNGTLLITSEIDKIDYHLPEYKDPDDFVKLLKDIGFSKVVTKINNNYIGFICEK